MDKTAKEAETKSARKLHERMAKGLNPMQRMFVDAIDFNKLDKLFKKQGL